jgi:hypothetical protein
MINFRSSSLERPTQVVVVKVGALVSHW